MPQNPVSQNLDAAASSQLAAKIPYPREIDFSSFVQAEFDTTPEIAVSYTPMTLSPEDYSSSVVNFLSVTGAISGISGKFVYHHYDKNEYTDVTDSKDVYPRWIYVKWDISSGQGAREINSDVRLEQLAESDLCFIADFNSKFISMTPISSTEEEQLLAEMNNQTEVSSYVPENNKVLDVATGTIINTVFSETEANRMKASVFNAEDVAKLACSIYTNPFSGDEKIHTMIPALFRTERKVTEKASLSIDSISTKWSQWLTENKKSIQGKDSGIIGYFVSKYDGDTHGTLVKKFIVSKKEFRDFEVLYGKTYSYVIQPIYLMSISDIYVGNSAGDQNRLPIVSDNDIRISVTCEEFKNPEPPSDISIEYIGNEKYSIKWEIPKNRSQLADSAKLNPLFSKTNDTKGIQIFHRSSIDSPFQLVKYITFRDHPIEYRVGPKGEYIPDEYVLSYDGDLASSAPKFFVQKLAPNIPHIFSLCAIDAHGNSSNYSEQKMIIKDSVTGKISVSTLSPEGAPKQFPNYLLNENLWKSGFETEGFKYCDIYYTPDTIESSSTGSWKSLQFQMIETNTSSDSSIVFDIKHSD